MHTNEPSTTMINPGLLASLCVQADPEDVVTNLCEGADRRDESQQRPRPAERSHEEEPVLKSEGVLRRALLLAAAARAVGRSDVSDVEGEEFTRRVSFKSQRKPQRNTRFLPESTARGPTFSRRSFTLGTFKLQSPPKCGRPSGRIANKLRTSHGVTRRSPTTCNPPVPLQTLDLEL